VPPSHTRPQDAVPEDLAPRMPRRATAAIRGAMRRHERRVSYPSNLETAGQRGANAYGPEFPSCPLRRSPRRRRPHPSRQR
jgi:hypothetical protein